MIICAFCGQMIAANRSAHDETRRQIGAYIRHLSSHDMNSTQARTIAEQASLHTVRLPNPQRSHEDRWMLARLMWAEGHTNAEIANCYEVSEKSMRTRIQRWRRDRGWFPARA